uniref:Uncharacterized protein n=1 Tax=Tetradesmus obliquus TaxID=3088 RepID=A0A383W1F5_TETOB
MQPHVFPPPIFKTTTLLPTPSHSRLLSYILPNRHFQRDRVATMVCKCESGGSCNCGSNCDCSEDCFCASCAGGQAKRVAATGCNMCSSHACKCSEGSCGCGDKCKCPKCAKA